MYTSHCQALSVASIVGCLSLIVLHSLLNLAPAKSQPLPTVTAGINENQSLTTRWQPSEAAIAKFSGLPDRRRGAGSR